MSDRCSHVRWFETQLLDAAGVIQVLCISAYKYSVDNFSSCRTRNWLSSFSRKAICALKQLSGLNPDFFKPDMFKGVELYVLPSRAHDTSRAASQQPKKEKRCKDRSSAESVF